MADRTTAERSRRRRQREREGRDVWRVEGDNVAVPQKLIAAGWLDPRDEDDREAIGMALGRVVETLEVADLIPASRVTPRRKPNR